MRSVLIVDDEPGMRAGLSEVLGRGGFAVEQAANAEDALARLTERGGIDLLVTDLRMPGMNGLELIRAARQAGCQMPAIVITAHGTVEDAVAAMKLGAFDFLSKPFSPADLLHLAVRATGERATPESGSGRAKGGEGAAPRRRPILTRDPALQRVLAIAESVASSRAPVLIQGESGTGKELLARYVHESGCRRGKPFVAVNCAALPRELLESELFGHERGAFTGAIAQRIGRFELADGGTIFLDEVGDIPLELQPKLLRVLQEHEFERLGATRTKRVDVRVVAATNRSLEEMVAAGTFRSDLYYRLNVFPISLPALRERKDDIPRLVRHLTQKLARRMNKRIEVIPADAMAVLCRYDWPGNVRELENSIERAVILTNGSVLQVPVSDFRGRRAAPLAGGTLEATEREAILNALRDSRWVLGGSRGAAARLGLKRSTLYSRMEKLGISRPTV